MRWRKRDTKAKDLKHDSMESHLREARRLHAARVRIQFPNWQDVVHDASEVVSEYELEFALPKDSFEIVFDEHGLNEGYFLILPRKGSDQHKEELLRRIRASTGETFDVEHGSHH